MGRKNRYKNLVVASGDVTVRIRSKFGVKTKRKFYIISLRYGESMLDINANGEKGAGWRGERRRGLPETARKCNFLILPNGVSEQYHPD